MMKLGEAIERGYTKAQEIGYSWGRNRMVDEHSQTMCALGLALYGAGLMHQLQNGGWACTVSKRIGEPVVGITTINDESRSYEDMVLGLKERGLYDREYFYE